MRCKIIEIGPDDAFFGNVGMCNKKGTFKRAESVLGKWLAGRFVFDDPKTTVNRENSLSFYQVRVEPIGARPK